DAACRHRTRPPGVGYQGVAGRRLPRVTRVGGHRSRADVGPRARTGGAAELRARAESRGDSTTAVIAGMAEALASWFTGDPLRARAAAEAMLAVYDPEQHGQLALTYIDDPKCLTLAWAGEWLWALGYPDQARQAADEQLRLARELGHPMNLFVSLSVGTVGLTPSGEARLAREGWHATHMRA